MAGYFNDNAEAVGRTPLVRLNKVCGRTRAVVLAKIEGRNPAYSVKDRIGVSMIHDAEQRGLLHKDVELVEPTSGNTGIALAYVCALKGYSVTLVMPDTMSLERRKLLAFLGAKLLLTEGVKGMKGAVEKAESIVESNPDKYFMPQQFSNPANPRIQEETTGPEIWQDTNGAVDALVCGVGTGGTITGISNFIKHKKGKKIRSIAVEPAESPVISQTKQGREQVPGPHKIQGIGAGFIPDNLDMDIIDDVVTVSSEEALEYAARLALEEGILGGISSGAAAAACAKLVRTGDFSGKTIVTVFPSATERYLTTVLFEGVNVD